MALTKVAPAGIGSTPGDGYRIGSSFLHSTGVELTNANASGIITAAQFDGKLNIGIATFTDDVKFTGATSGRDVLWDKSDNSLKFSDSTSIKVGSDNDLQIIHDTNHSYLNHNGTGGLWMQSNGGFFVQKYGTTDRLINANNGAAVELFYNATKRIETSEIGATVTGQLDVGNVNSTGVITATKFVGDIAVGSSITYADNEKAYFGTDLELQIYHSGSHSFIKDTGTGMLKICADMLDIRNAADNATLAYAQEGNKFELFYNGSAKLATTNTGVEVTGDITISDKIIHAGDTNTAIRFPAADQIQLETAGSVRTHIHSDGRFRVGCTAQPSGTVGGFQLDMGSYPGTLRLMSGAGASGTQTASLAIGGSNHNASIENGANSGGALNLYNYNSSDGNSTAVSFHNSNGLSSARVLGLNVSHSSRTGALVFMVSSGSHPTEKVRITSAVSYTHLTLPTKA